MPKEELKARLEAYLTLPNLIAWLKIKPEDEGYNYWVSEDCALTQFVQAGGPEFANLLVGSKAVYDPEASEDGDAIIDLPKGWDRAAGTIIWTFGSMLKRVEDLYAENS